MTAESIHGQTLFNTGSITAGDIAGAVGFVGSTPFYLYDGALILQRCREIRQMMPAISTFMPRYAMKANASKALLQLITRQGFGLDASSLNEVRRAVMAGIAPDAILLTTQEVPLGQDREDLQAFLLQGLRYTVCSQRQLELITDFALQHDLPLSLRVHPGEGGTGESAARDTANPFASFGVHISVLTETLQAAFQQGLRLEQLHMHIGSGGSPEKWRAGVDSLLAIAEAHLALLPHLRSINFGGGLKEARMPDEERAPVAELGRYTQERISEFHQRTGRQLGVEIEPGTYVVAMAGYVVTSVIDKKHTGAEGYRFIITNGGMEMNARPQMYGSRHPFALVSRDGSLLSSDYSLEDVPQESEWITVGRCCETGDAHSLDRLGNIVPRPMAEPAIGDYFVVGGCGAYGAAMSPANYNAHTAAPEVLKMPDGSLRLIRAAQTLEDVVRQEKELDAYA
jgi:diaminopimelate decarboxylase